MSSSFTEFITHFDNYSQSVSSNFTTITAEMLTSITTLNGLNKKLTTSEAEFQTSFKSFSNRLGSVESGLGQYKNFTLQKFETFEKVVENMDNKMINR